MIGDGSRVTLKSEALHETGTVTPITDAINLRTLTLLRECGYTHVRMPSWEWQAIEVAIDSATPRPR